MTIDFGAFPVDIYRLIHGRIASKGFKKEFELALSDLE